MLRPPVVAGSFYPRDPARLQRELNDLWPRPAPETEAYAAVMVPHAGYVYSGRTAAAVYARLAPADTYILLGPNHSGPGAAVAVASEQPWETPLGAVPVDADMSRSVLELCPAARRDDSAHRREHALEVQLPFLQKAGGTFSIVCISLSTLKWSVLEQVGLALAEAVRRAKRRTVIVASSDMNHFENLELTRRLDHLALEKVQALDPQGLIEVVTREGISMCGVGPAAAMLAAAKALGASQAEVAAYATSAEASGDEDRVVGYAGVLVK